MLTSCTGSWSIYLFLYNVDTSDVCYVCLASLLWSSTFMWYHCEIDISDLTYNGAIVSLNGAHTILCPYCGSYKQILCMFVIFGGVIFMVGSNHQ
jgi:hypothetical protein